MSFENNGRKTYGERNLPIRAWRIARDEGFWSLIDQIVPSWLPSIHAHLPSDFNSMSDIRRWLARHSNYDVYSFDVFDTLLRRRIHPPELIKAPAAEYLSTRLAQHEINISQVEILEQRKRCEELLLQEALSIGRDPDYRLDDVIEETLKTIKGDSCLDYREIVKYEIALEKKATQPMPGSLEVLSYLKSMGKRVICISDSYLSTEQMTAILESQGLIKYIDRLYVSADIGKTKLTGKLFLYVLEQEGRNLVHVGDNYVSDKLNPRRLGMTALWFHSRREQGRKNELRKLLDGKNKMDYVNAIVRSADKDESELYWIGYEVLGPALTVFIHNVAEKSRKDGVEALFFIARDGYVMKKIYEILQSSIYADQVLPVGKYMCLSRFSVRAASVNKFTSAEVVEVYANRSSFARQDVTLGDVLINYGLEPAHFINIANKHGVDLDSPINDPVQDLELNELLRSNEFQSMIEDKIGGMRKSLRDYLETVGFMGKRRVALVDSNSRGTTQYLLGQIFSDNKEYPMVLGYYFGLFDVDVGSKTNIKVDLAPVMGIVCDWRKSSSNERKALLGFGMLIELFSHPNHGVTVGYRKTGDKVIPVFKKTPQESQYGSTSQGLRGILSYAKDYGRYYGLHNYKCDDLLQSAKASMVNWPSPAKGRLRVLGDLFLTDDWPQESNHFLWKQTRVTRLTIVVRRLFRKIVPKPLLRTYVKFRDACFQKYHRNS